MDWFGIAIDGDVLRGAPERFCKPGRNFVHRSGHFADRLAHPPPHQITPSNFSFGKREDRCPFSPESSNKMRWSGRAFDRSGLQDGGLLSAKTPDSRDNGP